MQSREEILKEALRSNSAYIYHSRITTPTAYHSHDFVEMFYVVKGSGTHNINGKEYDLSPGDIFLINYDTKHQIKAKNGPLLLYNCIFTPSLFNQMLNGSRNFFDITDHFLISDLYANFSTDYISASALGSERNHILNIYERLIHEVNT